MPVKILHNKLSKELFIILAVTVLLIGGVIFENHAESDSLKNVSYVILLIAYIIAGWEVISKAIKNLFRKNFFDENFLMTIATLGAVAINQLPEAVMVMLLYNVGEFFQKSAIDQVEKINKVAA